MEENHPHSGIGQWHGKNICKKITRIKKLENNSIQLGESVKKIKNTLNNLPFGSALSCQFYIGYSIFSAR